MKVLGLMSGTSMDGLDCSYVNIEITNNLELEYEIIEFILFPFPDSLKKAIVDIIGSNDNEKINKVHDDIGHFFVKCCKIILKDRNIEIISMHGQTISHIDGISSRQIGNPEFLNFFFNVPIIYNFRNKDIQLGGRGAPLIPFLDWLLYKHMNVGVLTLNLGGISNLTFIPQNCNRESVLGFDAGPGMCLIDQYSKLIWNDDSDFNAQHSKYGDINCNLLKFLLDNTFIKTKPPKSTSRESFNKIFLLKSINKFPKISCHDFIRTLVNFTAVLVKENINNFIEYRKNSQLIISGGGANHPLLIKDIEDNLKIDSIKILNDKKLNVDSKESLLMAVMGYACYHNIPNNMINVTGAKKTAVYGEIYE